MSIYSGFATRHLEQTYDNLISDLLHVLQKRILKFYLGESTNQEKFSHIIIGLYTKLAKLEENKYLQPKMSKNIEDIVRYLHPTSESKPVFLQTINVGPEKQKSISTLQEPSSVGKIIRQFHENIRSQRSINEGKKNFHILEKIQSNNKRKNPEERVCFYSTPKEKNRVDSFRNTLKTLKAGHPPDLEKVIQRKKKGKHSFRDPK